VHVREHACVLFGADWCNQLQPMTANG